MLNVLKQGALLVLAFVVLAVVSMAFSGAIALVTTNPAPCQDASCGQPMEQDPR